MCTVSSHRQCVSFWHTHVMLVSRQAATEPTIFCLPSVVTGLQERREILWLCVLTCGSLAKTCRTQYVKCERHSALKQLGRLLPGRVVRRIGHIWGDLTATYCEISCGNAITRNLMREARSPGEISPQYGLRLRLDRLPNVCSHTVHTDSPSAETTRHHLVAGITSPSRCFHQLHRLSSN